MTGTVNVVLIVILMFVKSTTATSYSELNELYKNMTEGKNINLRPVQDHNSKVMVNISFNLVYIQEFNEVEGKLSLAGIIGIYWIDETVKWEAKQNGISSFTYVDNVFWRPSFIIGNSFGEVKFIYKDDSVKRVDSDGQMSWFYGDHFDVVCEADVTKYPFDTHTCYMQLLPWAYNNNEIEVVPYTYIVDTPWYRPHQTWQLVTTSINVQRDEYVQLIVVSIQIKRQPMFFVLNLMLPIVLMSILNILVFLLPHECGERVGYSVTILLAIAVFLTISSDSLPATANPRISSISLLLFADVFLSALIVVFVIIGLRFYHRSEQIPVSTFYRGIVKFSRILRCKCLCNKKKPAERDTGSDITWTDVGHETDIIFGLFVSAVVVTVNLLYIVDVTVGLPLPGKS